MRTIDNPAVKASRKEVEHSLINLEVAVERFLDKVKQEGTIATFIKEDDLVSFDSFTEEESKGMLSALEDYRKVFSSYQKVLDGDK